jgi:glycosyltransferase involved in cell wall biosynthesis
MPMAIDVWCMPVHVAGGSGLDLIAAPLAADVEPTFRTRTDEDFDERGFDLSRPVWFHEFPPPKWLLRRKEAQIIWSPMWDYSRGVPQRWWNALPKTVRIVSFSRQIAARARRAGLPTLDLQYFKNPDLFAPADWTHGRVMMYWNRTGLVGPRFLEKLCAALRIDVLLFRGDLDRGVPAEAGYELGPCLGKTVVRRVPWFSTRDEYLACTKDANVYLAPRASEGVGMVFLEAMARGCAVVACDAPTMSDYVTHAVTGALVGRGVPFATRAVRQARWLLSLKGVCAPPRFRPFVSDAQAWDALGRLDLARLGRAAREAHRAGYLAWLGQLPAYRRFVTNWERG